MARPGQVTLLRFQEESSNDACSTIYKVQAVYEYFEDTLLKDFQRRQRDGRSYSEGELFYLMTRLLRISTFSHDLAPNQLLLSPSGEIHCFSSPLQGPKSTLY